MQLKSCECEHLCHFKEENFLSPNGNPGHEFGAKFNSDLMAITATTYGHFTVCPDCTKDCMQDAVVVDCKVYES